MNNAWILVRNVGSKLFHVDQIQCVPSWTGFQKIVSLKVTSPTTIGNCRSIPAPPTDIQVVYNMMINLKKMLKNLGQPDPCITLDEAIYQLAKQVQWTAPYLEDVTVRLGGFHRAKTFVESLESVCEHLVSKTSSKPQSCMDQIKLKVRGSHHSLFIKVSQYKCVIHICLHY